MTTHNVLDACCGSRMMWFNKTDPRAVFADQRRETITVTDNSLRNKSGTRTLHIDPDTVMDFRAMPFSDGSFKLVAFDPPHLVHAGPRSWLAANAALQEFGDAVLMRIATALVERHALTPTGAMGYTPPRPERDTGLEARSSPAARAAGT